MAGFSRHRQFWGQLRVLIALLLFGIGAARPQAAAVVVGQITVVTQHDIDVAAGAKTYHFVLSPSLYVMVQSLKPQTNVRVYYRQADVLVAVRIDVLSNPIFTQGTG
jgi:hypothetical protein